MLMESQLDNHISIHCLIHQYEIEFEDGKVDRYLANVIAENMYSNLDLEGNQYLVIKEIVGHRSDESAMQKCDSNQQSDRRTSKGWWFLVECNDGSTQWVGLKDLKDGMPLALAEYAILHNIDDEPAFSWWVKGTMRKRPSIVKKLKSKYWKTTHKFGV
jgi:hypothetical protein